MTFFDFAQQHALIAWSLIGLLFLAFFYSAYQQRMKHQQRCGLHHVSTRRPE